ncbi:MAG: phosphoribosyl-ATP diphosphatase [Chloroflexota bacterium]|nr:phosphoribosyl-ATP diphosphatase [Chloroflexota bacterium]
MSDVLLELSSVLEKRKRELPEGSYTAYLMTAGENEILKKLGEEAVEVILAAKDEGDERVIYEMADLIYHALVLLVDRELSWQDVEIELQRRYS